MSITPDKHVWHVRTGFFLRGVDKDRGREFKLMMDEW